jgi:hypothetical protein
MWIKENSNHLLVIRSNDHWVFLVRDFFTFRMLLSQLFQLPRSELPWWYCRRTHLFPLVCHIRGEFGFCFFSQIHAGVPSFKVEKGAIIVLVIAIVVDR